MPAKQTGKGSKEHPSSGTIQINHSVSPTKQPEYSEKIASKHSSVTVITRRKCIIIEGAERILSFSYYRKKNFSSCSTASRSKLSCRNPFRLDENLVNYDMDTEDEMAEEQGEDVHDEQKSHDEESELLEE